jgi:alpha-tubulin suppressor-like RCC1 family protein
MMQAWSARQIRLLRFALLVVTGLVVGCGRLDDSETLGSTSQAVCSGTALAGSPGGPSSPGTNVTLTATGAACGGGQTAEYRFVFKRENTTDPFTVIRDYAPGATVTWNTTGLSSGKYQIIVYTRAIGSAASFEDARYLNYFLTNVCMTGALSSSPASPRAIGTQVTLAATATCTGAATPEYRFMYKRQDQTNYTQVAPFQAGPVVWDTTGLQSGAYNLLVYIRAAGNVSTFEGVAYGLYQLGTICSSVTMGAASPVSPQQPGVPVTLTASASCGAAAPEYRFSYWGPADTGFQQIQPYGSSASIVWDTSARPPGLYTMMVQARAAGNGSVSEAIAYSWYTLGFSVASLSAGSAHTCALTSTGSVKCFGRNLLGAPTGQYSYDRGLEAADMGDALPAVALGTGRSVKGLATGAYHACAILDNGSLKCWGANGSGALGLSDTNHRSAGAAELGDALSSVNLGTGRTGTSITAGSGFSCAILDDGSVKCWGNNVYGSLGLGDVVNRGDAAGQMGNNLPAVNLGAGRTAVSIAAGVAHTCAILDNGSLKCWGLNNYGQLGLGDWNSRGDAPGEMGDSLPSVDLGTGRAARALALGNYQTCALLDDASVKCWGYAGFGAIGSGDLNSRGDAAGEMGDSLLPVNLGAGRHAKSIASGGHHTCAILDDDSTKCWGYNTHGELGLGDTVQRGDGPGEMGDSLPALNLGVGRTAKRLIATYYNTCAELDNGQTKCWGAAYTGMLGIGPSEARGDGAGDMGDSLPSFNFGSGRSVKSFGSGFAYHYGCALLDDDTVKCWGANSYGQLGIDRSSNVGDEAGDTGAPRLTNVSLGTGVTVVSVGAGDYHSCALLSNGAVKCWGANLYGTSGLGDTARHDGRASYMGSNLPAVNLGTGRTATALYVGAEHSCAVLDNGSVKCWGLNNHGQLGLGDMNDRGDAPGEMGDALPAVALGTGRTVKSMHLGSTHSCAILDNNALKCWGDNSNAKLGVGDWADRGDGPGEMGDALPAVALGTGRYATRVAGGYFNTCAILDNGTLKCWGDNTHGQLGLGNKVLHGQAAGGMGDGLPAVPLGTGRSAVSVGVGWSHVCALLDNSTVKCWGYNYSGKLGYGDTADRGDDAGELGDSLPVLNFGPGQTVASLAVGWHHNCVALNGAGASAVRCWGNGDQGTLGQNDNVTRGDNAGEMGSALLSVNLGDP